MQSFRTTIRYQTKARLCISTFNQHLIHRRLRPHNTPAKELANHTEPIPGTGQLPLEQIMLISRFNLALANSTKRGIRRRADRTLRVLRGIKTTLVERVAAEEVHGGQVECSTARLATTRLEDDGLGCEVVEFLFLRGCFGFVACDEAAILQEVSIGAQGGIK
jgi:hypothetical protein